MQNFKFELEVQMIIQR